MIYKSLFIHLLQNTHIDSHKKSSVRHKLVSLTLKKKSKITEEVSDAVTMVILSCYTSSFPSFYKLSFELSDPIKTSIIQVWATAVQIFIPLSEKEVIRSHKLSFHQPDMKEPISY